MNLVKVSRFLSTRHGPRTTNWSKLSSNGPSWPFTSQSRSLSQNQNSLKNVNFTSQLSNYEQLRLYNTTTSTSTRSRSILSSRLCNFKGLLSSYNVPFGCSTSFKRSFLTVPDDGKKEKVDDDIIYVGEHDRNLRYLKIFSINSSCLGLICQGLLVQQGIAATAQSSGYIILGVGVGFLSMFTFVTPILIHLLCRRYITELRYDPLIDTYRATCYNFILMRHDFDFRVEDIIIPEVPGMFTTFLIKMKNGKKKPIFLAPNNFITIEHYGRFMGYDRPLDFYLEPKEMDETLMEIDEMKRIKSNEIEIEKSKTQVKAKAKKSSSGSI